MRNFVTGVLLLTVLPCPLLGSSFVVQQAQSGFVNGTTITAQLPASVTAGDLVLVQVIWSDNTRNVSSIGDTLGNNYTSAVLSQGATSSLMVSNQLFYAANVRGGIDTVSVTLSGSAFLDIYVYEIAGAATSNPLDAVATGNGTGLSVATGSATTTAANDFVFVGTAHHFAVDTPGPGFIGLQNSQTGLGEYQTIASAGTTLSGTATLSATNVSYPWAAVLAAFLSNPGTTSGGPPTLNSIQVTPFSPTLSMGQSRQFSAIGTFSDGSTQDLTSVATWGSSNLGVATISASGLATAAGHGNTSITASSGSVTGNSPLTVEGTLNSIQVIPANDSLTIGTTQQFTATGTFSDGSSENVTSLVNWGSSNTSVATINASGMATAVATGGLTITATSGAITGSTTLTTTQPVGGAAPVIHTPLAQTNFQWMSSYYIQNPPTSGGSSCSPAPCIAQTFLNANTAGNLIFVWVSWNTNGFALTSLSDSAGDLYTHVPGFPIANANGTMDDFWVAYNIAGAASNKVKATFGAGTAKNTYIQIMEYSGLATSNALDVQSNASQNPNCGAPCTLSSAPSPTTTLASELVVTVFDLINCGPNCGSVQFNAGSGWSPDANCTSCEGWGGNTVSGAVLIEHQVVSAIGSYTATSTENITNTPNYDAYLFTFKQATAGP